MNRRSLFLALAGLPFAPLVAVKTKTIIFTVQGSVITSESARHIADAIKGVIDSSDVTHLILRPKP